LNIARIVGGTLQAHEAARPENGQNSVRFNLEITINLKETEPKDLSAMLESLTRLIGPSLGRGRACCHINVEPVIKSDAAKIAA